MQLNVLPDVSLQRGQAQLQTLAGKARDKAVERERLKAAAKEFEGLMLEMMVKEMRKNVPDSPIFGRDSGRAIFNEMLDSQYVRLMVDRGGLGLADMLVRQLDERR
jgi:peptidoglycan hydrolase FlgJ